MLDTNVLLDMFSVHDFGSTYGPLSRDLSPEEALDHRNVVHRRVKARQAILLAMHLNAVGAATCSLESEFFRILRARVPDDEDSPYRDYVAFAFEFLKARIWTRWGFGAATVVPGWETVLCAPPTLTEEQRLRPSSHNADAWYVATAKRCGLALITHEGFTRDGYARSDIATLGDENGVTVLFPWQVYTGKLNEGAEIAAFLQGFREQAIAFLASQPTHEDFLNGMCGYLEHVLTGKADGRSVPVKLTVGTP